MTDTGPEKANKYNCLCATRATVAFLYFRLTLFWFLFICVTENHQMPTQEKKRVAPWILRDVGWTGCKPITSKTVWMEDGHTRKGGGRNRRVGAPWLKRKINYFIKILQSIGSDWEVAKGESHPSAERRAVRGRGEGRKKEGWSVEESPPC